MSRNGKGLASQARVAMKGVVRIHVRGWVDTNSQVLLNPQFLVQEDWVGSGFFSQIGNEIYIITNGHVARNGQQMEIRSILTSDEPFRVELVGLVESMEPDVALLRFCAGEKERFLEIAQLKRIPTLKLGDSRKVRRGEEVKAIGYPLGMEEPHISGGEISNFISGSPNTVERLVTDAAINPGNSGGPAVIRDGWVVGINTAIIAGANNVGFITPIHLAKNMFQPILQGEKAGVCGLGADIQKNSEANSIYLKQDRVEGVIVRQVYRGTLASRAGVKARDVALAINGFKMDRHGNILGERISRKRNLFDILHDTSWKESVELTIHRRGEVMVLKGDAHPWTRQAFPSYPVVSNRRFARFGGMIIQEVCEEILDALGNVYNIDPLSVEQLYREGRSPLVITHIQEGSEAESIGLPIGDFITQVQGQRVSTLAKLEQVVRLEQKAGVRRMIIESASGGLGVFRVKKAELLKFQVERVGERGGG